MIRKKMLRKEWTMFGASKSVVKGRDYRQMIKVLSPDGSKNIAATKNVQEKCNERRQGQQNPPSPPPQKNPLTGRLEIFKKLKSVESNLCLYRSKHVVGAISVEYVLGK